jgi:mRNA-degrading endonuclease RelE of RelBE toxin-antitoxin system
MKSVRTKKFIKLYDKLPQDIKSLADEGYQTFKVDPNHPSLELTKLRSQKHKHQPVWRVRVGPRYRALAVQDGDTFVWFWVGTHERYNQQISNI